MSALQSLKSFLFGGTPSEHRPMSNTIAKVQANTSRLPARLQAGNLQMIGLQAIREALGDEWVQRRDTIHNIVEGVIRKRLDAGDAQFRLDTDEYLVMFLNLTTAQAKTRAAQIAEEAQRLILGEIPDCDFQIASSVAEVDRDFVASKVDSLHELVSHIKANSRNEATAAGGGASGEVLLFGDEPIACGVEESAPSAKPMMGAGPDLTDLDQSLTSLFQKKTSAAFLKECQAAFYPNFSTKRRSFSFYTVTVTHIPTGRAADASDPMLEDPYELEFLLDRYRLTTALLGLHRMVTGGHHGIISIPVTFGTLAQARTRNIYLSRFNDLPAGLFRYISLIITNIPNGTPASRIADAINYIQRFCSTRVLEIAADPRLVDLYASTGCQAMATALPTDIADPTARAVALANFAKRVSWHKMESVLFNVSRQDDIQIGTAAGFSFLIGDAVAPMITTPGHRQALRADHIPQRAVAAVAVA